LCKQFWSLQRLKSEYFEKFLGYFNERLKIDHNCQKAFEFAQEKFVNDCGFILYKEIDLFLKEMIEIKEGPIIK
jgi:hypothetical protein